MLQLTSTSSSPETVLPDAARVLITERIRGEFREMPGLMALRKQHSGRKPLAGRFGRLFCCTAAIR